MSAETKFANNVQDLSNASGVDAGFQFEFYCQRCSDRWRTRFKPYRSAQAGGWLQRGASLFGGLLGDAGSVLNGMAEAGWHGARDAAFKEAVEAGKAHFNRCGACHSYVCAQCFDSANGLCFGCAPNVKVEITRSRAQGEVYGASQRASEEGQRRGQAREVGEQMQLVCPQCRTETHGAKFCPECGFRMGQQAQCRACSAMLEPGVKFCPECGQRQTA